MRTRRSWTLAIAAPLLVATAANAAAVKTYPFAASAFVEDPSGSWIYATTPNENAVQIINAKTLAVAHTISIGGSPNVLALSPDGATLYVGGSGSTTIARINTSTLASLPALTAPNGVPTSMQFGTNNRLWVLSGNGIHQLDATTGASAGPDVGTSDGMYPLLINGGEIHVSPDGKSLYYANSGYSPSNAYRYDVTGPTAQELWAYTGGGNGRTLAVSNANDRFAYASAGDERGIIAVNKTADASHVGDLALAATDLTFSANDKTIFSTFTYLDRVWLYDGATYQVQPTEIPLASDGQVLFSDNTSSFLFVGESAGTEVFAVPEPATAGFMLASVAVVAMRRKRGH